VQKLEEDLGLPLFHRDGHRPRLTLAGEELLNEGRLILQAAADLEARLKGVSRADAASLRFASGGGLREDRRHRRRSIGTLDVVAVAGGRHPLAAHRGPIPHRTHKVALLAGSSTGQPLRATLLAGQRCIALPDMPTLRAALAMGLAIALVPRALVALARPSLIEEWCSTRSVEAALEAGQPA
jgi:DNA-binding transcriptional LysR family regulator